MRAALGDVQLALRDLARSVATDLGTTTIEQLPPAVDAERVWTALADSGLLELRADGGSIVDLVVCAEEFGSTLSAAPFVGAALARELLGRCDERVVASLDREIAIDALGAESIAFVHGGHAHRIAAGAHGPTADRSRVVARTTTGDLASIHRSDEARFDAIARVMFGADLVGVGTAAILDAVEHARVRQQFGTAIGTFQSVQHLLADAWVDLVGARNALRSAAWRLDHDTPDALTGAARAKVVADEAGVQACEVAVQVLGGLGHTWEHLASVRLRRALVSRAVTPAPARHLLSAPIATTPPGRADEDGGFDLRDDAIEADFRSRLDAFLATGPSTEAWHPRLAAAGFVGASMPVDAGGGGLPVTCDAILAERLGGGGFPPPPAIAHLAHGIALFGTPVQRATHLAHLLDGSVAWCQGFSEPGAGSDLAGIRTRAIADGDDYVVNGRKIWTSDAAQSEMILLLCRTSDDRHRGLSILLLPLDTPGIEVSTILTAWGSEEFAEVSFSDVRVSRTSLLGTEGQGWEIAMAMLVVERGPADIGWIAKFRRDLGALLTEPEWSDREDVHRAAAWLEALDATVAATLTARRNDAFDASSGSIDKLLMTKVDQLLHGAEIAGGGLRALDADAPELARYLWGRAASVFGGTSQIQRSIVAQRLLGLPRT